MRCCFPKLTDNNATDNICQTNRGQTKFVTDVPEWVTWCKPISIIVPLVPTSNCFFIFFFCIFMCFFSCFVLFVVFPRLPLSEVSMCETQKGLHLKVV